MHTIVFYAVSAWLMVLIMALALKARRARTKVDQILSLDTLALLLIAELALYALHRQEPAYLDVALMLALTAFAQTIAAARYAAHRRVTP